MFDISNQREYLYQNFISCYQWVPWKDFAENDFIQGVMGWYKEWFDDGSLLILPMAGCIEMDVQDLYWNILASSAF